MPIYEYRCQACGKASQSLLPRFDSPDPACPHCGELRLRRQVSTFATVGGGDDLDSDFGGAGDFDPSGEGEGFDGGGDGTDDDW